MRGRDVAVLVLDEMQMLDQQIAPARLVAEQRADFGGGLGIDLAALRACGAASPRGGAPFPFGGMRSSGYSWIRIEPFQTSQTIPCTPMA